jgi:hypothetical protein
MRGGAPKQPRISKALGALGQSSGFRIQIELVFCIMMAAALQASATQQLFTFCVL